MSTSLIEYSELLIRWSTFFSASHDTDLPVNPNYRSTRRRTMGGAHGLWVQYNHDHVTRKRVSDLSPAPSQSDKLSIESVVRPFSHDAFHFLKADLTRETLFRLSSSGDVPHESAVLVNLCPVALCHSLIVPFIDALLPQVFDASALPVCHAILSQLSDQPLCILFNSLAAFASVNHLHFHLLNVSEYGGDLPIQRAPAVAIGTTPHPWIHQVESPCLSIKFDVHPESVADAHRGVGQLVHFLQRLDIAHTLIMSSQAIIVIPRQKQYYLEHSISMASFELSGVMIVKDELTYDQLTESEALLLMKTADLSDEIKEKIIQFIQSFIEKECT